MFSLFSHYKLPLQGLQLCHEYFPTYRAYHIIRGTLDNQSMSLDLAVLDITHNVVH